ncbi:hypothetical protein RS3R6_53060 [Pseudomonas atacamensis]|uniref:Adhesin n=1 Tax=Pseudomonas atacamensis TaxID=2565368 RepID=A0ABQ5PHF0_9PSED|nr:hypothetical protein RS3R1_20080 [Pseudomonas atacamensis]GLH57123.1 hypothetical protein RS3R6_53060 [Pseudomonas atacamensis]
MGTADPAGHAEDFLARGEPVDRFAHFNDRTGEIKAEHGRQRLTGVSPCAGGNFGIERIDSSGVNPDQDLPLTGNRAVDVTDGQRGLSGLGDGGKHGMFHGANLCWDGRLQIAAL